VATWRKTLGVCHILTILEMCEGVETRLEKEN